MNLCSYLAYIQVNELLVFRTQCLEYSWNEKQDTSAINTPHSYSYTSSPSHNDEWPCQGEGRPGTKADCSGLLGGGSSSDKAKSLQEEMSCWLKAFMQVSHQDLSGRSVLNVLNSQIWRILWNQAKQFAFLYISYLTFISQNFNNSIATVKPESKEKNKTKKKTVKKVDFSSNRVNWVLFEFGGTLMIISAFIQPFNLSQLLLLCNKSDPVPEVNWDLGCLDVQGTTSEAKREHVTQKVQEISAQAYANFLFPWGTSNIWTLNFPN